jgi:transmembrane sensor
MSEKDYTTYDATELAQEPGFVRWVRGGDDDTARFWEQWTADHPERSEVVEAAQQLVRALRFEETPPDTKKIDGLWDRINEEIDASAEAPVARPARLRRLRWLGYVAAAVALILLVLQLWDVNGTWEVVRTEAGQRLTYVLPDSSVIELNAASTIQYRPARFARERRVRLTGEAFFDVAKGPSFIVEADRGEVIVLGTSFNVRARKDDFSVDCFTGRVEVKLRRHNAREVLTAGRGTRITEENTLETYTFDESKTAGWRKERIYFEEASLGAVFNQLERQFDIDVESTSAVRERKVTGFFRLVHVDSALYDVTWPLNLEFQRDGRIVSIQE